eukprot:gene13318-14633_t
MNLSFTPPTEHSDGEDHHSDHGEERVSIGLYMLKDILGLIIIKEYFLWCYFFTKWNNLTTIIQHFINTIFQQVKDFSIVQSFLQKEEMKLEENIEKDLKKKLRNLGYHHTVLPEKGLPHDEILQLIQSSIQHENTVWENGKLSGSVYGGEKSHINFLNQCFSYYSMANVLHPDIWPSVMKYESEIVAMTASLVNGGKKSVCGSTTSGGTESIILAVKAHRDYYRTYHGITHPEMIACVTAHAAVDKACDLLGIQLKKVPYDPVTFRINVDAVQSVIGPNTIMMYASAPQYPHGAIDNIPQLSELAVKYNIGLHIDCCLGGFVLPFIKKLGIKQVVDFDFSLSGVSSMSLDTHKYGYALKGTSVVLYKNKDLRHSQYFCYGDWPGGLYSTPTILGSRSGGLVAQTWASLVTLGWNGFLEHTKSIIETTNEIEKGLKRDNKFPEIQIYGDIDAFIICFGVSKDYFNRLDIYMISQTMHDKGWILNAVPQPPSLHICVTYANVGHAKQFLIDLRDSIDDHLKNPKPISGFAVMYGTAARVPAGPVNELLKVYNDVVLKAE